MNGAVKSKIENDLPDCRKLKNKIRDDLLFFPQTIFKEATELLKLKRQHLGVNVDMKSMELDITRVVVAEKNEDGKDKYSNITKRTAETELRLTESGSYKEYTMRELNLKTEIENLTLKLEFMQREFSGARALARLVGE